MAFELVYTSVPHGIKPGSSGFCVAAHTVNMPAKVILLLEGLSAYKPFFPHYDAKANLNPVSYTHYICSDSQNSFHIFSRACFYGLDYTNRSNKLAHHIVAQDQEIKALIPRVNPAEMCGQTGMFRTEWKEAPQIFPQPKQLLPCPAHFSKAQIWESYTGDAGWAGILAQAFLDNPNRPVYVVFDPTRHRDLLEMVREALALLPQEKQWLVSYNTYLTMLPAGINCAWRFCTSDATILQTARRSPQTLIIDLTSKLPSAGEGKLQSAARGNVAPQVSVDRPSDTRKIDRDILPLRLRQTKQDGSHGESPYSISSLPSQATPSSRRKKNNIPKYILSSLLLFVVFACIIKVFTNKSKPNSTFNTGETIQEQYGPSAVIKSKEDKSEEIVSITDTKGKPKGKPFEPPQPVGSPETSESSPSEIKTVKTTPQDDQNITITTQKTQPDNTRHVSQTSTGKDKTNENPSGQIQNNAEEIAKKEQEEAKKRNEAISQNKKCFWYYAYKNLRKVDGTYEVMLLRPGQKVKSITVKSSEETAELSPRSDQIWEYKTLDAGGGDITKVSFEITEKPSGSLYIKYSDAVDRDKPEYFLEKIVFVDENNHEETIDCTYKIDSSVWPEEDNAEYEVVVTWSFDKNGNLLFSTKIENPSEIDKLCPDCLPLKIAIDPKSMPEDNEINNLIELINQLSNGKTKLIEKLNDCLKTYDDPKGLYDQQEKRLADTYKKYTNENDRTGQDIKKILKKLKGERDKKISELNKKISEALLKKYEGKNVEIKTRGGKKFKDARIKIKIPSEEKNNRMHKNKQ